MRKILLFIKNSNLIKLGVYSLILIYVVGDMDSYRNQYRFKALDSPYLFPFLIILISLSLIFGYINNRNLKKKEEAISKKEKSLSKKEKSVDKYYDEVSKYHNNLIRYKKEIDDLNKKTSK